MVHFKGERCSVLKEHFDQLKEFSTFVSSRHFMTSFNYCCYLPAEVNQLHVQMLLTNAGLHI